MLGLLAACTDGPNEPGSESAPGDVQFSREITLRRLGEALGEGARRVEIKLQRDGLVAREVEIEEDEDRSDDEKIESRAVGIDGDAGTIVLQLGALVIHFDATTQFRAEDRTTLTRAEFVARVEAALADGREPPVEVKRRPPAEPQAPDDASFVARELELDDEADEAEIEINVDSDNLVVNDAPPPDAWIAVLGLMIEIRAGEGITELEEENDDDRGETDFEGFVTAVDLEGNAFTLGDGTVVRLVAGTEIDFDADHEDELGSLREVADAIAAGVFVEADGKGVIETTTPRVVIAVEVEFEIEDDLDDVPGGAEFEGTVQTVNVEAGTFTLRGGTVVRLTDATVIDDGGDLLSLAAAADAVLAGLDVRAEGRGTVETTDPRTITARTVEFEVDD
jgi:hypothetical protein